jgi:hypothetical protein
MIILKSKKASEGLIPGSILISIRQEDKNNDEL